MNEKGRKLKILDTEFFAKQPILFHKRPVCFHERAVHFPKWPPCAHTSIPQSA